MKDKVLKLIRNPYFMICAVYLLTHFFMLILSGCWWDDWTFMFHDLDYINAVASQSGRPEWNFLIPLCWSLPNNGRILIFFLYLLDSIFLYVALKNSELFDERESLIITLLFAVIPVNDARILISNFSYTVGLFFFYLALMLFVLWNKMEKSAKKTVYRMIILALFFVSFILNSIMAYYYILFAYLFVLELKKGDKSNIIRLIFESVKNVLIRYPDFFIVPFVYYFFNKTFFPTYGPVFGNYNSVSISGLIKCLTYVPKSMVKLFVVVLRNAMKSFDLVLLGMFVIVLAASLFLKAEKQNEYGYLDSLKYFVYGAVVLALGLFPYVMVRGRAIDFIGVKGRDAVLTPLGTAFILFSLLTLLKGKIRRTAALALILLGLISFNSLYLEWQKDYYYQLSLENLLDNNVVRENDTFFLTELNETDIEAQRYYSLNANAYNVFHDQTRFFIPKVSNLYILESEENVKEAQEELEYSHVMRDYDPEDYCLDAVLDFDCFMNSGEVIELKLKEMFDYPLFETEIKKHGSLETTEVEDDFTDLLLKEYQSGSISNDADVLELLNEYEK